MENVSYKIEQQRQKTYIKAYAIIILVLAIGMGIYTYFKWDIYGTAANALEGNYVKIEQINEAKTATKELYETEKDGFKQLSEEVQENLTYIFPTEDEYTSLTKQIDEIEAELAKKNNPFEVSSLSFQNPILEDEYSILPLRMNIRASNENFQKFLHMMENSGSLTDRIRLMDISSIRLSFDSSSDKSEKEEIINFSVQLNAYYQK